MRLPRIALIGITAYLAIGVCIASVLWTRELAQFACRNETFIAWLSIRAQNPDSANCVRRGLTAGSLKRVSFHLFIWPAYLSQTFRGDPREAFAHGSIPAARYVIGDGAVYREEVMQTGDASGTSMRVNDILLVDADPNTFQTVPIPPGVNAEADADPQVMRSASNEWGKDAHSIFWESQTILPSDTKGRIDLETFAPLSSTFVKDASHVYEITGNLTYRIVPDADPKTFALLTGPYAKDQRSAYTLDGSNGDRIKPIVGIDPATFHVLGICAGFEKSVAYYTADAHTVMAGDQIVPGADATTFRLIATYDKNPDGMSVTGSYATDKNHVYADCGEVIRSGDPSSCTKDTLDNCRTTR